MVSNGSNSRRRRLTNEEIAERYKNGERTAVIAGEAGITPDAIRLILKKMNVPMRPRGSWKRKYHVNEHYFKTWSNNMAYILGFFAADGMIPTNGQQISFSQKDRHILHLIKQELSSNHPIILNETTDVCILNINSKIIKDDLIQIHGFTPKKSMKVRIPEIPENYKSHFVRGYFDGDGCVYKDKKFINIVCGSKDFIYSLNDMLEEQVIRSQVKTFETYFRLYVSGKKDVLNFFNWIYADKGIYMERKYRTFLNLLK
ncbi:LAGLIDADG family homing endonuclease [Halobacillus kuroshimensis]|uniref:LAGLIDADG family homing endonuclease n=1 Tax=Halobacillus kuroshimensis TaxID=302481 RepID=UPI00042202BA|nr:LAGLIDADG family homing endonuclease [Halobacillus kuroshimensis]